MCWAEDQGMILVNGNAVTVREAEWWSLVDNNAHLSTDTHTHIDSLELSLLDVVCQVGSPMRKAFIRRSKSLGTLRNVLIFERKAQFFSMKRPVSSNHLSIVTRRHKQANSWCWWEPRFFFRGSQLLGKVSPPRSSWIFKSLLPAENEGGSQQVNAYTAYSQQRARQHSESLWSPGSHRKAE